MGEDGVPRVRIFLSSPGDVGEERQLALAAIERVQGWYRGRVELDTVSWEREPLPADAPFQDGIPLASECDLAVVILWSRLGSPLPCAYARPDGSRPTGTEWEFEDALRGAEAGRTHVIVYRRTADPEEALGRAFRKGKKAGLDAQVRQIELVEGFFEQHFRDAEDGTNARAYHPYDTPGAFAQRFQEHLRLYLEDRLGAGRAARAAWQGSPFRGLLAFQPEHQRVFFGRMRAIHEVRQALALQVRRGVGFVLVLGRSGSGKSSLVRAGVVPLLSDPGVVDPDLAGGELRYALMEPGDGADPFEALALALSHEAAFGGDRVAAVAEILRGGPAAAAAHVENELARLQGTDERPVRLALVADQLEEIFTRKGASRAQRERFAETLGALARSGRVWVLATMRSDFYPALMDVPVLVALKEGAGQVDVTAPTPAELGEMIRQPAQAAGLVFDVRSGTGESLADALQEAAAKSPASLPLLQFTLERLYEKRDGARLTWAAYDALGGIEGAIARRAGELYDELPMEVADVAPGVLRALVEVGEATDGAATRRRAPLAALSVGPSARRFVDAFVAARLLVTDRDAGGHAVVSLAHDSLTTGWPLLSELVDRDRALLLTRARVTDAARHWRDKDRDASLLLADGKPLEEGRDLLAADLPDLDPTVAPYVAASARRVRRRRLLVRGGAFLLVALVAGAFLVQRWLRDRAVDDHLAAARTHLDAGEFVSALEAVAKAQDKDPESSDAERLKGEVQTARANADEAARRQAALASAEAARAEARRLGGEAEALVAEVETLRSRVEARRASVVEAYATTAERAAFARLENDLARKTVEAARLLEATREALERAARFEAPWGGRSDATNRAFADFYEARWNGVRAQGDVVQAAIYRDLVLDHDPKREAALLGRGTLTVSVGPAGENDAEVYLFRYASYETVRAAPPVVPRLVPVPTPGIGRAKDGAWVAFAGGDAFYPGDLCLVVTSVADPSPAAEAGLRPGDLVVRLGGAPCGDGLFVDAVVPGGRAAKAGVRAGQRIEAIDGVPVEGWYEWAQTPVWEDADPPYRVDIAGTTVEGPHDRRLDEALGFGAAAPADLVAGEAPAGGLRLACLRGGVPVVLAVPEGVSSGLQVAVTAYPLVLAGGEGGNRVPADAPLSADPGSYLLLVRAPGFEDQRVPVVVERGGDAQSDVLLRPAGSTPEGYVWVPPGPFVTGGDPDAFQAGPREVREGRGILIARTEVTYGAWFEFVNDPQTLAEIARAKVAGRTVVLPRNASTPAGYAQEREDGTYAPDQDEGDPVLGISREDLDAFLAWRNRRAEADGEPWVYDLPTEWEWEQAARGADGRHYPWGDRFDPSLCVGLHRKAGRLYAEAPGFEPRDASPCGVLDLAGSRWEWTRDEFAPGSGTLSLRGGAWGYSVPVNFRCAYRNDHYPSFVSPYSGFRLVVRPRPR